MEKPTPANAKHGFCIAFLAPLLAIALLLTGCRSAPPTAFPLARELIFSDWEGDMPQSVLDAFSAQTGVKVVYSAYSEQEGLLEAVQSGRRADVLVLESRFIPLWVQAGLLRPINYQNVPNFKNISPNFRGLAYDPDNRYSIPFNWGTTALVVRSDLVQAPVTRWADLWDPRYAGRVAIWPGERREVIALTLKSLGYSANSENPDQLQAALDRLIQLKPNLVFLDDNDVDSLAKAEASGQAVLAMGYAGDVIAAQAMHVDLDYVYPEEGALLWGDNFVIPASCPNPYTAELFLNFLLRPEINAQIANQNHYATPNEAAYPLIDPDIRDDPKIFPPSAALKNMEIILPLSSQGQALYDRIWQQFLAAAPVSQP